MAYLYYPKNQFFDNNGDPLSGGKIYTYITATSTPKATYTDATGGSSHPNPVVLDSAGRAEIWLADDAEYRIIVKNAAGTQIGSTIDNQSGVGISVGSFTSLVANLDLNGFNITGEGTISINEGTSYSSTYPKILPVSATTTVLDGYPAGGPSYGTLSAVTTFTLVPDRLYFVPIILTGGTTTISAMYVRVTTAEAAKTAAFNIYASNSSNNAPTGNPLLATAHTCSLAATGNISAVGGSSLAITGPGVYWLAIVANSSTAVINSNKLITSSIANASSVYTSPFGGYHAYYQAFTYSTTFPAVGSLTTIAASAVFPGIAVLAAV